MVTADAMHTQVDTAQWIHDQGGHYLLTVKNNQPGVRRTLKKLPWKNVPSISSVDTSRGRRVRRTVKAVEAPAWVDFPGAAQVVQVRRTRTTKNRRNTGKNSSGSAKTTTVEVVYLVCSLPMTDAQPETVATWIQGHWGIENRLHWVKAMVFDECPASSSWQGFFLFEGGDGRAGAVEMDFEGPVPGDGFVRAHGVVFDAVVLSSLDQRQCVGDVAWEQALVSQRSEPAFPGPVLAWCPGPCADMPEFGVAHDEQFEVQRPERATIIGHNRDHGYQHAGVLVDRAGIHERMPEHVLVVGQGELDRRD